MLFELQKLWEDIESDNLPKKINDYKKVKCDNLSIGKRIYWYFKEDLAFWEDEKKAYGETEFDAGYSGIIVPVIDCQHSVNMYIDDVVVIHDVYPVEKENCEVVWVSLKRLIDNVDLIEVIDNCVVKI